MNVFNWLIVSISFVGNIVIVPRSLPSLLKIDVDESKANKINENNSILFLFIINSRIIINNKNHKNVNFFHLYFFAEYISLNLY